MNEYGQMGLGTSADPYALISLKRTQGDYIRFSGTMLEGGTWALHNGNPQQDHLAFHYYPASGPELLNRMVLYNNGSIGFADNGLNISQNGKLGIGTDPEPNAPIALKRNQGDYIQFKRTTDNGYWAIHNGDPSENHLAFHFFPATGDALYNRLVLWNNGKVSIGNMPSTPGDYGLYVEKGLLTERVKVAIKTEADWSDHVLQPSYLLMPLPELSEFIREHGHLPQVPSAKKMVTHGLDVAQTDAMLLAKIEELTLYILQLEGRINVLESAPPRDAQEGKVKGAVGPTSTLD